MGSKKKKEKEESSSSSSSDSDSSESSPERSPKQKSKKRHSSPEESSPKKKAKERKQSTKTEDAPEDLKRKKNDENYDRERKRKRSPSPSADRRNRDDRRVRDDRSRHENRRDNRQENRFRNRRDDYRHNQRRDRRDDRDYRNRRDDRNRDQRRRSTSFDHANAKWGRNEADKKSEKKEKEKPNFGLSGKLTEETNTYRGVVIKYSEPPEARKPKRRWRLYPFKGEKALQTLYIHRESAYLIGRDRKVVDLPVDHPSCSKQHAALQYRLVPFTREDGTTGKRVRPYLIDLNSANGTFINNKKIEPSKYVELLEKDVIKFGFSSREYVLLHENSKDEAQDDDVKQEDVKEETTTAVVKEEEAN